MCLIRMGIVTFMLLGSMAAAAEDRVVLIWDCDLNEGKTMDDVKAANDRWVAYVNKEAGGDIRSFVASPVVGETSGFRYLDSFPSLEAWSAQSDAMQADAGQAIEAALNEAAACERSTLYNAEESG